MGRVVGRGWDAWPWRLDDMAAEGEVENRTEGYPNVMVDERDGGVVSEVSEVRSLRYTVGHPSGTVCQSTRRKNCKEVGRVVLAKCNKSKWMSLMEPE